MRRGHAVFRQLFFPTMIALSVTSWAFHEAGARALSEWRLPLDFATAVLLSSIVIIWCAEQLYPMHSDWNYRLLQAPTTRAAEGWHRLARDLLYLFVIATVGSVLITWLGKQIESGLKSHGFGFGIARLWPAEAPFALRVVLAFLLVELFSYWFHRLAHRAPLFWRFHQTHHVVHQLTALKAVRTNPIDNAFFYVARIVPLMLIGAGSAEVIAVISFGATLGLLSHANVDVSERVLGWVVNYPRYHAVHHSADLAESNSNFGCHTIVWDRVFGTFRSEPAPGPVQLGVHPLTARSLWQELVAPPKNVSHL